MGFKIERTERVDDRRNKRYGRAVWVYIPAAEGITTGMLSGVVKRVFSVPGPYGDLDLTNALPGNPRLESKSNGYHAVFFLKARRPSEILSDEQARLQVESYAPELVSVIRDMEHEVQRSRHRQQVAEGATKLLQWALYHLEQSAKDTTRYRQRRAALDAELREEAVAQRKHFLNDETLERVAHKHGHGEDEIRAVRKALTEDAVRENLGSENVFGVIDVRVSAEDVE